MKTILFGVVVALLYLGCTDTKEAIDSIHPATKHQEICKRVFLSMPDADDSSMDGYNRCTKNEETFMIRRGDNHEQ